MPLKAEYSWDFHAVVNMAPWTGPETVWTTGVRGTSEQLIDVTNVVANINPNMFNDIGTLGFRQFLLIVL